MTGRAVSIAAQPGWRQRLARAGSLVLARAATAPQPPTADDQIGARRLATFRQILGVMPPGRLLDLGTGHGKFALIGQELGWDVTAVDARTTRMPMVEGIRWVQSDVRTFDVSGYDCIALLGLLYHLTLADQRDLLRRCAGTPTILDTHHSLQPALEIDGLAGHMYREPGATAQELAGIPTASVDNAESFWPTRESLVRMLDDAGYRTILALDPPIIPDRTFYLCL